MSASVMPSPAPRAVAPLPSVLLAIAGGMLVARSERYPRAVRVAATVSGLALIGAAAGRPLADSVQRAGIGRRSASLQLSLLVAQPVEVVFAFVSDFENFPCIIGALRQVRDYSDGRSHWCASTPAGGTLEWDTVTTKYVPHRVIAWRSIPGAPVTMHGQLRFVPDGANTCMLVELEYRVEDSGWADTLVALTTPRREAELERDIRRLSTYLRTVRTSPGQAALHS